MPRRSRVGVLCRRTTSTNSPKLGWATDLLAYIRDIDGRLVAAVLHDLAVADVHANVLQVHVALAHVPEHQVTRLRVALHRAGLAIQRRGRATLRHAEQITDKP